MPEHFRKPTKKTKKNYLQITLSLEKRCLSHFNTLHPITPLAGTHLLHSRGERFVHPLESHGYFIQEKETDLVLRRRL